jgi:hypothetical protein
MSTKGLQNSTDVNSENASTQDFPLQPLNSERDKLSPIEVVNALWLNY